MKQTIFIISEYIYININIKINLLKQTKFFMERNCTSEIKNIYFKRINLSSMKYMNKFVETN
jgi:hypothetical protein